MAPRRRPPKQPSGVQAAGACIAAYLPFASIPLIIGPGCLVGSLPPSEADVGVLVGQDSAGASIEIVKRAGKLSRATVSDIVLGTADAEVSWDAERLSFTITFPAAVAITYTAQYADSGVSAGEAVEGTWVQHAGGLFGEDAGTWAVKRESPSGS